MSAPKKRPVPPIRPVNKNLAEMPTTALASGYDVFSWSPGKAGEGVPCTHVHLVLPISDAMSVTMRLKSPRALDELVAVLLQHRDDVWPGERPMTPNRVELEAERTKIAEAAKLLPQAPIRALDLLRGGT